MTQTKLIQKNRSGIFKWYNVVNVR